MPRYKSRPAPSQAKRSTGMVSGEAGQKPPTESTPVTQSKQLAMEGIGAPVPAKIKGTWK